MARVTIDSGPITADLYLRNVPREKWHSLMFARRTFLQITLPHDCRELLRFVEEAEQMFEPLGFATLEDLVREGFGLEPEQVAWAVEGLKRLKPNEAVPYAKAQELGKRGRPKKGEGKVDNIKLKHQGGTGRAYVLARLDRDGHAELAAKVRAQKLSANAAAQEAGFRKPPAPPLERIRKLWDMLDRADRRRHLEWTLSQCATCGRQGTWEAGIPNGEWCDACCDEGSREGCSVE